MAWFGTGETRLCSLVSKDRSYKPVVKSSGAQRESDGVVVPSGELLGKGPDFGRASGAGTREGMAGTARSNYPGGRAPIEKVRRLQRKLWAAAKQSEGRLSTPCMTRSAGMTSWWRRGGGCERIVAPPGSIV